MIQMPTCKELLKKSYKKNTAFEYLIFNGALIQKLVKLCPDFGMCVRLDGSVSSLSKPVFTWAITHFLRQPRRAATCWVWQMFFFLSIIPHAQWHMLKILDAELLISLKTNAVMCWGGGC